MSDKPSFSFFFIQKLCHYILYIMTLSLHILFINILPNLFVNVANVRKDQSSSLHSHKKIMLKKPEDIPGYLEELSVSRLGKCSLDFLVVSTTEMMSGKECWGQKLSKCQQQAKQVKKFYGPYLFDWLKILQKTL